MLDARINNMIQSSYRFWETNLTKPVNWFLC